MPKFREYD